MRPWDGDPVGTIDLVGDGHDPSTVATVTVDDEPAGGEADPQLGDLFRALMQGLAELADMTQARIQEMNDENLALFEELGRHRRQLDDAQAAAQALEAVLRPSSRRMPPPPPPPLEP